MWYLVSLINKRFFSFPLSGLSTLTLRLLTHDSWRHAKKAGMKKFFPLWTHETKCEAVEINLLKSLTCQVKYNHRRSCIKLSATYHNSNMYELRTLPTYVSPLSFLQYSPFTEFCNQLTSGVFQTLKALFWQDLSKYTPSAFHSKFIALTLSSTWNFCVFTLYYLLIYLLILNLLWS